MSQPESEIVAAGELGSFSVLLADPNNAFYQWRFNGTNITRATNDSLLVFNVAATNQGLYSVIVGNTSGSVTSTPAMLWYDGNGNGLPDSWELQYFGNLNQTATGDFDGDGVNNLQEFWDGTNPTNSASANYRLTVLNDGGTVNVSPNQSSYTNGQLVTLTALPGSEFCIWLGDIGSLSNTVTVVMNTNITAFAHFKPVDFIWTNLAGGDWFNTTNWNVNQLPASVTVVPNAKYNVLMTNGSYTVTLNTNVDLNNLTLGVAFAQGPTITGSGTLTVHQNLDWEYGTMNGSGRTVISPGATMTVGAYQTALNGRTLENAGTAVWVGTSGIALNSAVITNDPGALFNAQTSTFINASSSRFDNAGTFLKSLDPGTTTFGGGCPFNNYGTVDVESGAVLFGEVFTNNGLVTVAAGATNLISAGGSSSGGVFNAAAGSLVQWGGATGRAFNLTNGVQLNGPGLYRINGSVTLNLNNNNVQAQNFDILTGNLSGNATLTVNGAMNAPGGNMSGSGRTVIASGASLNLGTVSLSGWTLENAGTTIVSGSSSPGLNSSIITNDPGALFNVQNSQQLSASSSRFDNAGTFRKNIDPGTTTIGNGCAFNNFGTVDTESGTLLFNNVLTNNGVLTVAAGATNRFAAGGAGSGGTFTAAAGSLAEWTGGSFTIANGSQLNGAGQYRINGSVTLTCNNNVPVQNLDLFNGNLAGTGNITISNLMNWFGGSMNGTGTGGTLIATGATLNASTISLNARNLENDGMMNWNGTGVSINSSVLTNAPGGLIQMSVSPIITGSACRIDNAGTFRKLTDAGTASFASSVPFNNYGLADIESGTLSIGVGGTNAGSMTVAAGTALNLFGGTFNSGPSSSITGTGTFTVNGANATLAGLVNVSGTNNFTGGTANLTGTCISTNNTLTVSGGTADFNGSAGMVSPSVLNLFSGTLGGSNRVTVLNTMTWPGGVMGDSGVTFVSPTATLNASGGVTLNRTLENAGHVIWTGTGGVQASGAVITNDAGALFDVQNNVQFDRSSAACRFDNAGTFRKSIVSGTTPFSSGFALDNYGTVDIETGIIFAAGGFTNFPGALVNCALGGTTAGTGYGQLQVSGAMALNAGLSVVLTNSYSPAKGDSFTLLTGGTRSGTFTSFTFPSNQIFMVLSNGASSVIASIAAVNSNGPPSIASDLPASLLSYAGRTVSLPVTVFGATPFTYQWMKNGTNVSDTARISGSQTSTLTITNPLASDSGSYQLLATNAQGFAPSTASGVTIQAVPKLNTAGAGWSLQGSTPPVMNSSNVTLTSGLGSTGRSVFYNAPLYIGAFNASFLYKDVGGGGADGMSFCLQNDPRGATAQGGGGGGLGYAGITPSAAFEMNIYSGNGVGISFQTNGNFPASGGYTQTTPVNIASGNPIQVSLVYTGGVLSATLVESNTVHVFTTNIAVNLPAIVGGQTAYVGFTGGDGGISSTQVVSNFTFVPIATVSAQQSNAAMVTLSWPGVIGGYTVQSSSNLTLGAWQSVTNDILQPAGQNRVNIPTTNNPGFYRLFINLSQ